MSGAQADSAIIRRDADGESFSAWMRSRFVRALRRIFLKLLSVVSAALLTVVACASMAQTGFKPGNSDQAGGCAEDSSINAFLGISTIRLWPGNAPQASGTS